MIKEINRLGVYQEFGYDAEDRLKQKTKFDVTLIKTVYDAKTNTTTEEYADGSARVIRRDIAGRIIRIQSEAGATEYRYDAGGNCIEQKELNPAQTITYEYDAAGNVIKLIGKERIETYEHDVRGRTVQLKDGAGIQKLKLEYDALNRIIKIEYPNDITEMRTYNAFGGAEKIWVKDKHNTIIFFEGYIYDSEERLTLSINDKNEIKQYFYDEQYRIREVLSSVSSDAITAAKFEAQRAGLTIEGANTQGEIIWLNQDQKETLYAILKDVKVGIQYALEKPFTVWKEQYGYDNNGNRTTKTTAYGTLEYNYDSENRLSRVGKITYTYDANVNLLLEDEGGGVKKEFTYTAFDKIKTSRVYFGGAPNVSLSNTYRYDGLQRRVLQEDKSKKTLRSVYIQTSLSVLNEWEVNRDGSAITNRRIGSRQYFYASGELYSIKEYRLPNSDIEYFYKDRQGSIKATAQGDGRIRKRIDYSAFGEPLGKWNLSAGYTGKPYDFNTRLSNYGFRDYAPQTGRFTTVDPIRDGSNWYVYCNNDPVNWVDLWGLSAGDVKFPSYAFSLNPPDPFSRGGIWPGVDPQKIPDFDWPLRDNDITSPFGERKDAKPTMHDGIDLKAPSGTPVYAAGDGKV